MSAPKAKPETHQKPRHQSNSEPLDTSEVTRILDRVRTQHTRKEWDEKTKDAIASFAAACAADRAVEAFDDAIESDGQDGYESDVPESDEETRRLRKFVGDLVVPEIGPAPSVQGSNNLAQSIEHTKKKIQHMLAFIDASIKEHEEKAEECRQDMEVHLHRVAAIKGKKEKFLAFVIRDQLN